jgi:2-polyprenyl-3-methyl-5-hydroxy-6-metoxy-1,4-benzoquinol methylase
MSKEFWNANAEAWSEVIKSQGIPSRSVTIPALLKIIESLNPESILDIGCGEGFLAPLLLKEGIDYHGLDVSEKLVEMAKEKFGPRFEQVSYDEITNLTWNPDRKFDLVLFNFSLFEENISKLLEISQSFLNPQGGLLIKTLHPCFGMTEYKSGWNTEDFKTMSVPFSGTMPWYGRTLSDWHHEFRKAGLSLRGLYEPKSEVKALSIIFELV